ncbi:hypothetical protein AcV5_006416 [Taiwanofungus camphoratus]|nr:hypothetical protein AcV5_006416 [Antrodia cinnamomea]
MFSVIVLVAVDYIIKNLAELGSIIQMNILWDLEYLTSDQQIIKCLLVTNFGNYVKSKVSDGYVYSVLGTGVFNSDVTHPAVFTKLRVEILGKVGPIQKPTFEIIRELPYLKAVINKTLRLFPPVPLDVRYSVKEGNLPNSDPNGKLFYVPANTSVRYSVFAMHRRADLWGPDALEFDPYRFLDERLHKYLTNHRSSSYPSMQGPASALDSRYALLANVQLPFACNEISFFPIKLLQRLSGIELDHTAQPPDSLPPKDWASASGRKGMEQIFPKVHLTMYVDGGLDGDELSGLQV